MLLFLLPVMFLNIKYPILKQLEAFTSLPTCALQTVATLCAQEPLFLN